MIFARKIYKIPEFYMIFARKMPEFYVIIARKKYFYRILGGHVPPPPCSPSPTPTHRQTFGHIRLIFVIPLRLRLNLLCICYLQPGKYSGALLPVPSPLKVKTLLVLEQF